MKPNLIFLFFCLVYAFPSGGQTNAFTIKTNNPEPVQYCKDTVFIADKLTIEGDPNINSVKVSITKGFVSMIDELIYKSLDNKITGTWFPVQGFLILSGSSDPKEYEAALRNVRYYKHFNSGTLATGPREIIISLGDADYLPATGHFYRFIGHPWISWTDAKKEAEATTYFGMHGYLATITTAVENSFIQTKTKGVGWIGASDRDSEGMWKWVTGPEGLNGGTLFWKGSGAQYKSNQTLYGPVNNAYSNWNLNDTYSEPNNSGGSESYAHITFFSKNPIYSYFWNDLPDAGGTGDYCPAGYLIEFGGMPGDPVLDLTATIDLQVNTIGFDPLREITICKGDTVQLNREDAILSYTWTPSEYLSSATVSNPKTSPENSQRFLATATHGICKDTASFKVNVNPLPVSLLNAEENICEGTKILLNPGVHSSYRWNTGSTNSTIEVSVPGTYSVNLKTAAGCKLTSTAKVFLHKYPVFNISGLDTLICGSKSTTADITSNAENFSLTSTDPHVQTTGLGVKVSEFGSYSFIYQAIDQYCTSDTTFKLGFHKIPEVSFSIDSTKCYHYNLSASYVGDATVDASRFVWVFGGDTITDGQGIVSNVIPLGVNQSKRDLSLTVTDQGCSDSYTIPNIKVIPNLKFQVADKLGCEPFKAEFKAENSEKVTYDWDYGDSFTEHTFDSHTFHTYQKDGFYNVKLKVTTDIGCTNSVSIDSIVYVAPIPTVGFSLDPSLCLEKTDHQVSYVGSGDQKDTYNWDLSAFDPSEIVQNPGTTQGPFTFNLINKPKALIGLQVVSKYGCKSEIGKIEVKRKPSFSFTASGNRGCNPLDASFSANGGDPVDQISYTWDFGDGAMGNGSSISHTYSEPDHHYTISLTGLSMTTGCSDSMTSDTLVFVFPKPVAGFTLDHSIVYNDKPEVKFKNQSQNADHYLWDFSEGTTSQDVDPSYKFKRHGYKKVLLEAINTYRCSDTISQEVLVALNRIFPPNAFSPNAPNEVDREFKLNQAAIKEEGYHLVILSRWDDIVFETRNEIKGWDGKLKNGDYAPAGNYVWVLDFIDFLGRKHSQSGTVTLVY
ncbi:MAG: PKD domain-containing protein [Bacteroidota bacterium]|nr:PKD domain-containing protein [Bacteroidota bacterium]